MAGFELAIAFCEINNLFTMKSKITFIAVFLLLFTCGRVFSQINFLDGGFGVDGISYSSPFKPAAMALQTDGKILVTGTPVTGSATKLYRFNADGTLDHNFGNQGSATAGNATSYTGVRQQPDGKILLVGTYAGGGLMGVSTGTVTFAKFNPNGTPDISFGENGILKVPEYAQQSNQQKVASVAKVKFLSDGSIICAGSLGYLWVNPLSAGPLSQRRMGPMVTKFNSDLSLDITFGSTGYVKIPYTTVLGTFTAMDVLSDGSVITGLNKSGNILLYKYLANGILDTTFGVGGIKTVEIGSNDDRINDITVLANGKVLISGSKGNGSGLYAYTALLNSNGDLDQSYGINGVLTLTGAPAMNERAMQTIILNNGMAVTGMQKWGYGYDFQSVFTTASGAIDTTVANSGVIFTGMPNDEFLTCLMQQPDGKLLVAGYNENNCIVMRYNISSVLAQPSYNKLQLSIYPNPTDGIINISGLTDGTVASLYNVSGQKLIEIIVKGETQLNMNGLAKGMYFLHTIKGFAKVMKK